MELMPHQEEVLDRLSSGKILWGGVGSGKSRVALAYYLRRELIGDIVVITTAKKRDSLEWEGDAAKFGIGTERDGTVAGTLTVDSWNNIGKYVDCSGCFFIFDEQRVVGNGAWVKSFQKIVKNGNAWLILSATPGDTWLDYIPVFVANKFYKNPTEFAREHIVYKPFMNFPMIDRYLGVDKLERLKRKVLVEMPYASDAERVEIELEVEYDSELFQRAFKDRWNVYEDRPIESTAELFAVLRKIVYSDPSRLTALRKIMEEHPKVIVFYNFNYELDILRGLNDVWSDLFVVAEWNGHKKEPIPQSSSWVYLVQYTAGAEGWNCIETDTIVFYSLNYSYKVMTQAKGRVDRLNSPFKTIYYYSMLTKTVIDRAVCRSLALKKTFNERKWVGENMPEFAHFDNRGDV